MPHYSRLDKVVIDVAGADHDKAMSFWQAATGLTLKPSARYPEYHGARLPGQRFALVVQRLGEGPSRIHLDIHTDDPEAEVARLERLGATKVEKVHIWWIMRDPAGMLFCVIPERPGSLNDDNAQRWD